MVEIVRIKLLKVEVVKTKLLKVGVLRIKLLKVKHLLTALSLKINFVYI